MSSAFEIKPLLSLFSNKKTLFKKTKPEEALP
jgi:hypothetical protein